jgi:hypothetical protein
MNKEYTPNKSAGDIMNDIELLRRMNKPKNLNRKRRFIDFGGLLADLSLAAIVIVWVAIIAWAIWSIFNR